MRSRPQSSPLAEHRARARFGHSVRGRLAAVALASLTVACGGERTAAPVTVPPPAPDHIIAGPQGAVGQFVVECRFSHYLADDPIVHPGEPGGSHLHQFFGSEISSVSSTDDEMRAGATSCDQQLDTASYWTPALLRADREPIEPIKPVSYYRAALDVVPLAVVPYPPGLMMVSGNHAATEAQPLSVVAWSCGTGSARYATPPDCVGAPSLRMTLTFPDCWNGSDIRSSVVPQPNNHVAYSTAGVCPTEEPVSIPQLQFAVDYPPVPADELDALVLSSGSVLTGHGDFWNTWDQAKLRREVVSCIHRNLPCGVSG